MTKLQALQAFWESFGMKAYNEKSVPIGDNAPAYPYITYQASIDYLGEPVALSASVWAYSESWAFLEEIGEQIGERIGRSGAFLDTDNGYIWLNRGTPFVQMGDENEDMNVKRIIINTLADFVTADRR